MHNALDTMGAPVGVTISAPGGHVACPFRAEGLKCGSYFSSRKRTGHTLKLKLVVHVPAGFKPAGACLGACHWC